MGNIAVTKDKVYVIGDRKEVSGSLAGSGTYATNGDALTAAALGLELELNEVILEPKGAIRLWEWDKTNAKVKIFTAFGTEATNGTDQSAQTTRFVAKGKGSAAA